MAKIKFGILVAIISVAMLLTACGKNCSKCGKSVGKGYELLGNFYCEACFKRGIL